MQQNTYFSEYCSRLRDVLKAQVDLSGGLKSSTDKGYVRETFCSQFLGTFLSSRVMVGSGEVIDSYGGQTGQTDIVLYDSQLISFKHSRRIRVFLVEGCLAAVEVKSKLTKQHLFSALDSCMTLKSLSPSFFPLLPNEVQPSYLLTDDSFIANGTELLKRNWYRIEKYIKPRFYVFAFSGPSDILKIRDWVACYASELTKDLSYEEFIRLLPDLICVMDSGLVYKNDGFAFNLQPLVKATDKDDLIQNDIVFVRSSGHEVDGFVFHVLEATQIEKRTSRLRGMGLSLNLRPYFALSLEESE